MAVVGYTLTEEAVADITDVVRDQRNRSHSKPPRGSRRGLSRQGLIEVLLTADLPSDAATPATGYLMKRSSGTISATSQEVDVYGDCDLHSELSDPLLAPRSGCRVICGWLGGVWRALRRSGGCCSSSSSSSSSVSSDSSPSSSESSEPSSSPSSEPSSESSPSEPSSESSIESSSESSDSTVSSDSSLSSTPSSESSVPSSDPSTPSSDPSTPSDPGCVEVVKDVTFDATACTITKTMVNVRAC